MATQAKSVDPFDLLVFGGAGDLAHRKLIPALFHRHLDGQIPETARIFGASRRELTDSQYRDWAREAVLSQLGSNTEELDIVDSFLSKLHYLSVDATSDSGWDSIRDRFAEQPDRIRVFYLAVSPEFFGPIAERIGLYQLTNGNSRVVLEKPIGKDGESANLVNEQVGKVFNEDQIFRIDHYLGKETVQNLMALRFGNALFEPLWNSAHIDHVQITVAESIGVGSRVGYYDTAGALRDMVQNHILQLLCLVAMEPPASLEANSVRDEKLKVLRALKPFDIHAIAKNTVRGQYIAGASEGGAVPGYLEELGNTNSSTETFAAIKAEIQNWRWSGVPFYLRTGKRLAQRVSDIVIHFKEIPHNIFNPSTNRIHSNRLVIRLQPDEGVKLWLMIKDPGPGGMRLRHVPLDMSFAEAFDVRNPDAYERLITDVIQGNPTLFMRRDEVEAAWTWCDSILSAWSQSNETVPGYTSGTWGPSASVALIERDGRTWHE